MSKNFTFFPLVNKRMLPCNFISLSYMFRDELPLNTIISNQRKSAPMLQDKRIFIRSKRWHFGNTASNIRVFFPFLFRSVVRRRLLLDTRTVLRGDRFFCLERNEARARTLTTTSLPCSPSSYLQPPAFVASVTFRVSSMLPRPSSRPLRVRYARRCHMVLGRGRTHVAEWAIEASTGDVVGCYASSYPHHPRIDGRRVVRLLMIRQYCRSSIPRSR